MILPLKLSMNYGMMMMTMRIKLLMTTVEYASQHLGSRSAVDDESDEDQDDDQTGDDIVQIQ